MSEIIPKTLFELPYVDGKPDINLRPDQQSIFWIVDGECLGAANYKGDNTGELNRTGVSIQKNAATLIENDGLIDESLREIISMVNAHDVVLGEIGDDNLANRVDKIEKNALFLEDSIESNRDDIIINISSISEISDQIGSKSERSTDRSIYEDLHWIKSKIGAYPNQDISGGYVPDSPATGMVNDIINNHLRSTDSIRRVSILETKFNESGTGALESKISQIRSELGDTIHAPPNTVYTWIEEANVKHFYYDRKIEKLISDVGDHPEGIDERIEKNKTDIHDNASNIKTNKDDISGIREWIGGPDNKTSIEYRLSDAEYRLGEVQEVIEFMTDEDVIIAMSKISTEIGADDIPESIKGRLFNIESDMVTLKQDVATLKAQVGSNTTGAETGIYRDLSGLNTAIHDVDIKLSTKINDAPDDGKMYVRQSGAWVEFTP